MFTLYRSPKNRSSWEIVAEGNASWALWEDERGAFLFQQLGIPTEGVRIRVGKPKTNNWLDVPQWETNEIISIVSDEETASTRTIVFKTEKLKYKWVLTR